MTTRNVVQGSRSVLATKSEINIPSSVLAGRHQFIIPKLGTSKVILLQVGGSFLATSLNGPWHHRGILYLTN